MYDLSREIILTSLFVHTASEYLSGSPFGSNYQLPLVGLSCSSGASNISECQVITQTTSCNHQRTIGVFCKGTVEIIHAPDTIMSLYFI